MAILHIAQCLEPNSHSFLHFVPFIFFSFSLVLFFTACAGSVNIVFETKPFLNPDVAKYGFSFLLINRTFAPSASRKEQVEKVADLPPERKGGCWASPAPRLRAPIPSTNYII